MSELLMRAVVQAAAFFELSSDDVLDPDVAVTQLEDLAHLLNQLSDGEKHQLVAFVHAEAERAESAAYRAFLREFPEGILGITA
jgi:hypothetical protein